MTTLPETRAELEGLRNSLVQPFQDAKASGDQAEMKRLTDLAGEIDDALDDLAIETLAQAAARAAALRVKVDALTKKALAWPFGSIEAPKAHERLFREVLPDNDFQDAGPTAPAPAPAPVPSGAVRQSVLDGRRPISTSGTP